MVLETFLVFWWPTRKHLSFFHSSCFQRIAGLTLQFWAAAVVWRWAGEILTILRLRQQMSHALWSCALYRAESKCEGFIHRYTKTSHCNDWSYRKKVTPRPKRLWENVIKSWHPACSTVVVVYMQWHKQHYILQWHFLAACILLVGWPHLVHVIIVLNSPQALCVLESQKTNTSPSTWPASKRLLADKSSCRSNLCLQAALPSFVVLIVLFALTLFEVNL